MDPYQHLEGYCQHSPPRPSFQQSPYPPYPLASPYPPEHRPRAAPSNYPPEFYTPPEEPTHMPSHYAQYPGGPFQPEYGYEPPRMPPQYAHTGHQSGPFRPEYEYDHPHMSPQSSHIAHQGRPSEVDYINPPPSQISPQYAHIGHRSEPAYPEYAPHFPPHETASSLPRGQEMKVFCKVDRDYMLACHNDSVVMVPVNRHDETQQWIKDESFGLRVRDSYGFPAFALVNKGHKKVLKHAREKGQQVLVVDYRPGMSDDNILWTESQDFEGGYRTIRMANDTLLNMTVFHGDRKLHGLRNGSPLVLDTWHNQDNQLWKILPL